MSAALTISIAQIDPEVGAIERNIETIRQARAEAAAQGADLVVTTEFSAGGYPVEDLVRKPAFAAACEAAIENFARETADGGPAVLLGGPWRNGDKLHNAAWLLDGGAVAARVAKHELPNYGVFDEKRVFDPGPLPSPVDFRGARLGVLVCEDWWLPRVPAALAAQGAEMLLSINGSPFEEGKQLHRIALGRERVRETGLPFVFAAQVGGQDELVFEGASFVLDAGGTLAVQLPFFEACVQRTRWRHGNGLACEPGLLAPEPCRLEAIWRAMTLGLADYVNKNRFPSVILGLSGGIDSAISAAVAVDALGAERVRAVMMPSPYTSQESLEDAAACAHLLGIRYDTVPIGGAMSAFESALAPLFAGRQADITEENLQSRSRGLILMAMSNKFGSMLLTTGNKSEMSVGYATLYGDMCGGYSVLKDIYKTTVFELAHWRNAHHPLALLGPEGPVMPLRVITKPPSAELKPGQTDQDTLPPYEILDAILAGLIEGEESVDALAARGFDRATVLRVWRMLDRAEYKRRQAPPGVKIGARAFGRDRRYPITNGFTALVS